MREGKRAGAREKQLDRQSGKGLVGRGSRAAVRCVVGLQGIVVVVVVVEIAENLAVRRETFGMPWGRPCAEIL